MESVLNTRKDLIVGRAGRTHRACTAEVAAVSEQSGTDNGHASNGHKQASKWQAPAALTVGSTWGTIWNMSWPMVLNMTVLSLANFCEGWIAGRLGPDSLSAVGIASQIWFFAMLLTLALSAGTISVLSRNCGAGDRHSTIESARQALFFSVIFGGAISIVSLLAARPMLSFLGASPAVAERGWDYLKFTGFAALPYTMLWISNSVLRAKGEARLAMVTQLVVCACTIILDFLFCLQPFHFGLSGVGMSWLCSSILGITINIFAIKRSDLAPCLDWVVLRKMRLSPYWLKQFLSVGLPASVQDISLVCSSFGLFFLLGHCLHPVASQAAWAAGWRLEETVTIMPVYGLNIAAATIIGQNVGANKLARAKSCGWQIATIAGAINILIAAVLFLFATPIAAIMCDDAAVAASTVHYLQTIAWTEPFFACWLVLSGCMQGAGYTRVPMAVTVACFNGLRLALGWYLCMQMGLGAAGIWVSMAVSTIAAGLWLIWVWNCEGWHPRTSHKAGSPNSLRD